MRKWLEPPETISRVRAEVDAEEVADGVRVLGAVQPPGGDAARIRLHELVGLGELAFDKLDQSVHFSLGRLRRALGRHLAGAHALNDALPVIALGEGSGFGVGRSVEAPGGQPVLMAAGAILRQHRLHGLLEGLSDHSSGKNEAYREKAHSSNNNGHLANFVTVLSSKYEY